MRVDSGAEAAGRLLKEFKKLDPDDTGTASLEDLMAVMSYCEKNPEREQAYRKFFSTFRHDKAHGVDYMQLLQRLFGRSDDSAGCSPDDLLQAHKLGDINADCERIPALEDRAITLRQLESLWGYVEAHCEAQGWQSSDPEASGRPLRKQSISFYDVLHWVVKPATRARQCSYVELVATGAQRPAWFAAHCWGTPLRDLVKCLWQHHRDRKLHRPVAYWIYAFARSPWSSSEEETGVWKAMIAAQGTVTVVDREAKIFSRVWCAYEIFLALSWTPASHLRDIYTASGHADKVVGLTEGPVAVDKVQGDEGMSALNKALREQSFPIGLAVKALKMDFYRTRASHEADWRHILNAVAGASDLDAEPPAEHGNYDRVNRLLRGFFAVRCWRVALECGSSSIGDLSRALRESDLARVELQLFGLERLAGNMDELAQALPTGAETKSLSLQFGMQCFGAADDAANFAWGFGRLQQLNTLSCDLLGTIRETEAAKNVFLGLGQLRGLSSLTLRLYHNALGADGVASLAAALSSLEQLTSLRLVLRDTSCCECGNVLAAAVGQLTQLSTFSLRLCHDNFGAEGVGALAAALVELRQLRRLRLVLSNNALGDNGGGLLAAALGEMTQLTSLELDLCNNALDAASSDALATALQKLHLLTSLRLDLRGNILSPEATSTLNNLGADVM